MFRQLITAVALACAFAPAHGAEPAAASREAYLAQLQMAHVLRAINAPDHGKHSAGLAKSLDGRVAELKAFADRRVAESDAGKLGVALSLVERVQRLQADLAKRSAPPREFLINEDHPTHWRTAPMGDDEAACRRAIDHPLEQPLRISLGEPGTVWLRIAAPAPGTWAFDTFITEFDTRLSLYRDCRDIDRAPIESSDDALGMGSVVGFKAQTAGETRIVKLERIGGMGDLVVAKGVNSISISGRVTRADTGAPIAGLLVMASRSVYSEVADSTDSDGRYSLNYYYAGNYRLRTGVDYYYAHPAPELVDSAWPNGTCVDRNVSSLSRCSGDIEGINLADGESASDVDFALPKGATITGRVTSESDGSGLSNVEVKLRFESETLGNLNAQVVATDSSGRFRFFGVAPADWRIEYNHLSHVRERWDDAPCGSALASVQCPLGSGDPLTVSGEMAIQADAVLEPLQVVPVSLRVAGEPITGTVSVYTANGLFFTSEATDAAGIAYVGPLPAGEYRLIAQATNHYGRVLGGAICYQDCLAQLFTGSVVTSPAPAGTLLIADLEPFPGLAGEVTAVESGEPLQGAQVAAYALGNAYPVATDQTDVNGGYSLEGLPPGSYFVHVRAPNYVDELYPDVPCESDEPLSRCSASPLTFQTGQAPQNIDFALNRAGTIQGRVRAYGSNAQTYVVPSQATLVRYTPAGLIADSNYLTPLSGGIYGHAEVPMGTHKFMMRASGFRPQLYAGVDCAGFDSTENPDCPAGSGTELTWSDASTQGGINFMMTSSQSRLVRVRDADTLQPLAGVSVDQWSTTGIWMTGSTTNAQGIAQVRVINPNLPSTWSALITTDNVLGYIDQVHEALECAVGTSAYAGNCALTGATPVLVYEPNNAPYPQIEILLRSADPLFKSDFE